MGKRWGRYQVGKYRLGQLGGEAVVTWSEDGRRKRWRLGVWTESEGRAALDRFAKSATAIEARLAVTLDEIWANYIVDRELDGKKTVSMKYHWAALRPRFGLLIPADIDADICRDYAKTRVHVDKKSVGTAWTELNQLRSLVNWARARHIITLAPYVWVPAKPNPRDRVLDMAEVERLLDACITPHIRLFVTVALCTAARTEAILELKWSEVDFAAGTVDLRSKEELDPLSKVSRKGRALVPMNDLLKAALQDAQRGALTDHVIEWDGAPVQSVKRGFVAAVARAGLVPSDPADKVTPHTLRHTANTWMQEADIPPEMRAKFLGHKRVETNQANYSHAGAAYLQPAAKVLDLKLVRKVKNG